MQTTTTTADQIISNATTATENNAAFATKRYTDNLVTGKRKVPMPVMVICILGLGGFVLSVIGLLIGWQLIAALGTVFLAYTVVAVTGNLLAILWMLQMKKKGAYLYAALFIVSQIVMLAYGAFSVSVSFLISLAVTGVALYYSKQMK